MIKYNIIHPFNEIIFSGKKDAVIDPKDQYATYTDKQKGNYKLGWLFHLSFYTLKEKSRLQDV